MVFLRSELTQEISRGAVSTTAAGAASVFASCRVGGKAGRAAAVLAARPSPSISPQAMLLVKSVSKLTALILKVGDWSERGLAVSKLDNCCGSLWAVIAAGLAAWISGGCLKKSSNPISSKKPVSKLAASSGAPIGWAVEDGWIRGLVIKDIVLFLYK
jgi:hypothetical protein